MKLTVGEWITKEWRKTFKTGNKMARLYYESLGPCSAVTSWEVFKTTWAGEEWIKRNQDKV